jgi:hypothetical protein
VERNEESRMSFAERLFKCRARIKFFLFVFFYLLRNVLGNSWGKARERKDRETDMISRLCIVLMHGVKKSDKFIAIVTDWNSNTCLTGSDDAMSVCRLWQSIIGQVSHVCRRHISKMWWTTNFMEKSPWEANSHSASQEIPHILWNPKVN